MIYRNQDGSIYKIKFDLKQVNLHNPNIITSREALEIEEVLNYLIRTKADDKFSSESQQIEKY